MADTQIDELRLDITVEDKTSGESSDKKVKNLATAISRLNKNLQAFDNAKFTKVFDDMSKGIDPFVKKIEKVSNALSRCACSQLLSFANSCSSSSLKGISGYGGGFCLLNCNVLAIAQAIYLPCNQMS